MISNRNSFEFHHEKFGWDWCWRWVVYWDKGEGDKGWSRLYLTELSCQDKDGDGGGSTVSVIIFTN